MLKLSLIKRTKNNHYLGLSGLLLFEVPNNDKAVQRMVPDWIKLNTTSSCPFSGHGIRLILTNIRGNVLVIIKNSKSVNGVRIAQLIYYNNESMNSDKILLNDLTKLSSHRWPSGKLFIKSTTLRKHSSNLKEVLQQSGWVVSSNPKWGLEVRLNKH